MSHFKLIQPRQIDSPHDGDVSVWLCSATVRELLDAQRPAGRRFTANGTHNTKWLSKFEAHTDFYPDALNFARSERGMWYVEVLAL